MAPSAHRQEEVALSSPRERALDAMAHAVRRARELTQEEEDPCPEPTSSSVHADVPVEGHEPTAVLHPVGPEGGQSRSQPPLVPGSSLAPAAGPRAPGHPHGERVLRMCVVVVAALVLGLGGALAALQLSGPSGVPSSGARATRPPEHSPQPAPTTAPTTSRPTTSRPTTAAPGPAPTASGSTPRLVSVSPSAGRTGQVVTVSGVNLYSPDGFVQATLGGAEAPISCQSQTTCSVTVPAGLGPPQTRPITIETETGTSNALSFSYE